MRLLFLGKERKSEMQETGRLAAEGKAIGNPPRSFPGAVLLWHRRLCPPGAVEPRSLTSAPSPLPCFPLFLSPPWPLPAPRAHFSLPRALAPEVLRRPAARGACGFLCASVPFHSVAHSLSTSAGDLYFPSYLFPTSPHHLGCQEAPSASHSSLRANIYLCFYFYLRVVKGVKLRLKEEKCKSLAFRPKLGNIKVLECLCCCFCKLSPTHLTVECNLKERFQRL